MNILLNRMHKTRLQIIRIFALLLLFSSTANEAWAAKVRYHILTLPFSVRNYNNSGNFRTDIRVEALLVINDAEAVGLPEQYKSPLAKNFKYWATWETPTYDYLFHYGKESDSKNPHVLDVKYYIY